MSIHPYLAIIGLIVCQPVSAQIMERSVGAFDIKMATTPIRSMAQGLVMPSGSSGSMHGGLDLTHESGFYMGQWSPSIGVSEGSTFGLDSYMGFKKKAPDNSLGYELGVIRYSHPDTSQLDSYELYAGFRVFDTRIGSAFSSDLGRSTSTIFMDLGGIEQIGLGLRVQYATHRFSAAQEGSDGSLVSGFNDWSMSLTRSWLGIDMNLTYSGSTLDAGSCNLYAGHNQRCEQMFSLKAARALF